MSQDSSKKLTPEMNAYGVKVMGLKSKTPKSSRVSKSSPHTSEIAIAQGIPQPSSDPSKKKGKKALSKSDASKAKKKMVTRSSEATQGVNSEAEINPSTGDDVADLRITEVLETPLKEVLHAYVDPIVPSPSNNQSSHGVDTDCNKDSAHLEEEVMVPNSTSSVDKDMHVEGVQDVIENSESDEVLINTLGASASVASKRQKMTVVRKYSTRSSGKKLGLGLSENKKRKKVIILDDDTPVVQNVKRKVHKDNATPVVDETPTVELDKSDTSSAARKRKIGKRIPENVPAAPLDNISFHSEESVGNWKDVYQRRIAQERELTGEILHCQEIMELIETAGLLKTVTEIGGCYDKLVREFIVNVTTNCTESGHPDFRKVFVRGRCVHFSPEIINQYLGRSTIATGNEELSLSAITNELTAGQVMEWPFKGLLSSTHLSVKYAILNRIGAANWAPTTHNSDISSGLAKLIYLIGTKAQFDFGEYVFAQTMKHADTFAVKLPIGFPCLLCGIILSQHPQILLVDEVPSKKASLLTIDYRLLAGAHVSDVAGLAEMTQGEGTSSHKTPETPIAALIAVSKMLQDTITSCTLRKKNVDTLILQLTKGKRPLDENAAANDQNDAGTSDDDTNASD
ncbi:uncharacterized protein LOC130719229 [Lotus japonicus]|uniref:uncharacterized protein LOC130719229 n=1 Tax=Lotus japonicus TaxID=34305 RepID=UPI00258D3A01|nr:uncharacterized protein LOC130719229 [Lotus japonicus]